MRDRRRRPSMRPWPVALLRGQDQGLDRPARHGVGRGRDHPVGRLAAATSTASSKTSSEDATVSLHDLVVGPGASIPADLKQGDRVIALVKPNFWVKGGSLTMQVFEMRHVGLGDLLERLERLRSSSPRRACSTLERKKRLPFLPHSHRPDHRQGLATPRRTCCATRSCAGRRCGSASCTPPCRATGRCRRCRPRIRDARRRPRGRRHHRRARRRRLPEPARLQRRARWCAPPRRRRRRSSAPSATRPTARCSTRSPTCAPPRRPTPRSASCPDVAEELARVQQARARIGTRVTHLIAHEIDRIGHLRSRPVLADVDLDRRPRARGAHPLRRPRRRAGRPLRRPRERAGSRELARAAARPLAAAHARPRLRDRASAPAAQSLRAAADAPAGTPLPLTRRRRRGRCDRRSSASAPAAIAARRRRASRAPAQ